MKSYLFYNDAIIKRYWKGWKELNRLVTVIMAVLALGLCLTAAGCSRQEEESDRRDSNNTSTEADSDASASSSEPGKYTLDTKVADVINDPVFEGFGRLIFPVDRTIDDDLELKDVGDILVWYNNVNPERTVEIVNYLHDQTASGNQIFYDIYTDEEKAADLCTLPRCMTVSLMLWSFPRKDIMPLH